MVVGILFPLTNFGEVLDEATLFLLPWLRPPSPERLDRIIMNRSMHSLEWRLYNGEPVTVEQVEKAIAHFRQTSKLSRDNKLVVGWLEKNLKFMRSQRETHITPNFRI